MSRHNCRSVCSRRFTVSEDEVRMDVTECLRGLTRKTVYFYDEDEVERIRGGYVLDHYEHKILELWDDRLEHIREANNGKTKGCCK